MAAVYSKTLHALAHRLSMTDDQYRDMLKDRFGVISSKSLTDGQARILCSDLAARLPKSEEAKKAKSNKPKRFAEFSNRESLYASPAQLRMLEAAFVQRSYMPTLPEKQLAFTHFIKNKFGINSISWIEQSQVSKIFKAIVQIKQSINPMEATHG